MKLPLVLLAGFCLAACAGRHPGAPATTRGDACSGDDAEHLLMPPGLYESTAASRPDPAGASVPLLRAPKWEAGRRMPTYRIMKDGSYIASYKAAGGGSCPDYLTILGTPRKISPMPFPVTGGPWRILGKNVPWFATGNEYAEISTQAFVLTAPDGRSATYKIIFGGGGRSLEKRLPELGW